jgi:hypothetical protein
VTGLGSRNRLPGDGDSDRPLWHAPDLMQQPVLLAASIAGLVAAVGVAVLFALALSMCRDRKQLRELLDWHEESLAETPPVPVLAPPSDEDADGDQIAA